MREFPCETSPAMETAWRDLERRSLLRNPFLSPAFVFPQQPPPLVVGAPQLLTIINDQGRWLAAGLFERVRGTRQLPLPHLRAVRMQHAYKTGMLVDATHRQEVMDALWDFTHDQGLHGLAFPLLPIRSPLACLLAERCEREQLAVITDDLFERATVKVRDTGEDTGVSVRRAKSLRRGQRALQKHGELAMRFRSCSPHDLSAVEQFLYLEALGWKGNAQTALACQAAEAQAFREVALGLASRDRIRFAELVIENRVIASMCLLRSEADYYAFKIGWDPQFERGCPGFLLAHEIRQRINELPGCERIDSCAAAGSFLEHVWPDRKLMCTALFTTTRWGSIAARGTDWIRGQFRRWKAPAVEQPPTQSQESLGEMV